MKVISHILCFILYSVIIEYGSSINAQNSTTNLLSKETINFEHISVEEGLSSNMIMCIIQNRQGFLWIGTWDGLNRYDGYNFTVYKHDPSNTNSLSDNNIFTIFEDHTGLLWIGTAGGGLDRYDPATDKFKNYKHDGKDPKSLSNNRVYSIQEDNLGFLWIGTMGGGLNKFDRKTSEFNHYINDPNNPRSLSTNRISEIYEDKSGILWVGTDDYRIAGAGLNKYERTTDDFTRYSHDPNNTNSLSENAVYEIYEDRSGILWIGTGAGGLNQFDPKTGKFKIYTHDPNDPNSLSDNAGYEICEDRSGILWIGTDAGGLNQFDPKTGKFKIYTHNPNNPNSLSSNLITSIYEDNSGILWIGTRKQGINKYDRNKVTFIHYKHDPKIANSLNSNRISGIYEDESGILWIGTWSDGLNEFDRANGTYRYYKKDSNDPNSINHNNISSILEDKTGTLWIGTDGGGLNIFDRTKRTFKHYELDHDKVNSLSDNNITFIYEDRAGFIWVGTSGGGFNKFDPGLLKKGRENFLRFKKPRQKYKPGLFTSIEKLKKNNRSIASLLEVGNNKNLIKTFDIQNETKVLIVSTGEGLDNTQMDYSWIENKDEKKIWSMDYKKSLFAGGAVCNIIQVEIDTLKPGKYKLHYSSDNRHSYGNWVALGPPDKPELWGVEVFSITEEEETYIREKLKKQIEPNSISGNSVTCMVEEKNGIFWIGTQNGLNRFDQRKNVFKIYKHDPYNPNSLSDNNVLSIHQDKTGLIWIGTKNGLNKFDPRLNQDKNEIFIHFTEQDGLPSNVIYGILEDEYGNLWLSTKKGLAKFNPGFNKQPYFKNYFKEDGLQGNVFRKGAYHKSKSGEMFFGGTNGLTAFSSHSDINFFIPKIVITDFQLFNQPVEIGSDDSPLSKHISETDEIILSYEQNVFSFEITLLHYAEPKKNRYAYLMEGFDNEWIYPNTMSPLVTYMQLDPGNYVFRVKGSNSDGVWNEEGTSICVIITPPWWATWWAYIIYGLFLVTIIYSLRRYDLKRVGYKHSLELKNVEAEKYQEIDRMKSTFFTNISHEFRTPLTLILGPSNNVIAKTSEENTKKQVGIIKKNANRLLDLINQLLDLSKLDAGKLKLQASYTNMVTFVRRQTMLFESLAKRKDIALNVMWEKEQIDIYFDKEKIEKILTNLLSNAFKFTSEGGEIVVGLRETDKNSVILTVRDTGIGIPQEEIPRLFDRFYQVDHSPSRKHSGTGIGLALTKELVELHHGTITVNSRVGKGTEFIIELPLGKEHLTSDEIVEVTQQRQEEMIESEEEYLLPESGSQVEISNDLDDDKTIILVVEDNQDVREFIKESLGDGYKVEEAENGEQGVNKALEIIPDLIISDLMMPKMDGNKLTSVLKNDEKTNHIPIIILTAKSEQKSKLEGLTLGADDYLTKPFDTDELLVRINNLIDIRKKLQEKYLKVDFSPSEINEKKLVNIDEQFIQRVMEVINEHIAEENFRLDEFGREIGMSRMQLHRKLKALTGNSSRKFIRLIRLEKALRMIKNKTGTISEISYSVGFGSPAYFSSCFKEEYGYPPQ
ncbi:two-component regulator propeller domain-containing protein [Bacteroidota bacterium]